MKNSKKIKVKINIMKNKYNLKVILFLSLITFYSCTSDDFLEKPPLNELSTEASYASEGDAEAAIGAIYGLPAQMSQHYYKWQHTIFSDMRADNTHSGFVADIINVELWQASSSATCSNDAREGRRFLALGQYESLQVELKMHPFAE